MKPSKPSAKAQASDPKLTDPKPPGSNTAIDWCAAAKAHCETGDFVAAVQAYQKALNCEGPQGSRDCQTWNNQANALSQLRRYGEALAAYDRAIALNPTYHPAWFNRGQLLTEMGAYGNALESYERAIALQPDPVYLHAKEAIWLNRKLVTA